MYLHEFQAKTLFSRYGIPVCPFHVVSSHEELEKIVKEKKLQQGVLKIQVHAGGRGKAGGIKMANSAEELIEHGKKLLGMRLVNAQTGPNGVIAEKVMIDTPVNIQHEYYLSVVLDRKMAAARVIASAEGGVEIEAAGKMVISELVPDSNTLRLFQLQRIAKALGWEGKVKESGIKLIQDLVKLFFAIDAILVEINPLVQTKEGALFALDAKVEIDDNALFRHADLETLYDVSQISPNEREAKKHDLAYVSLDGNIGCIVNGAGLAMATMDLLSYWKGKAANFLDVGGGASVEKVTAGLTILQHDPKVKVILVNIFGGIMNCEIIAKSMIQANGSHPIVVRMEGTNVESARAMLKASNMAVFFADNLDDAAKKVVELANGHSGK